MIILLVEDERKVASFIKKGLNEQAYIVDVAFDGLKGQKMAIQNNYDLIILDILLPEQDGMATCKNIRNSGVKTPILMLTALGDTGNKVKGLNLGADDYLAKPFKFEEFLARVRALTRRYDDNKSSKLFLADLELDPVEHIVKRNNIEIRLTSKEFAFLEYLLKNKKKVLSRVQISEHVWGIDFDRGSNVIETYIKFLRNKIDKGFSKPLIHTVIGSGYVIKENF